MTMVVAQKYSPDRFFIAPQQVRLSFLMNHWRSARAAGTILLPEEQAELESLTEAELYASGERAGAMADELRSQSPRLQLQLARGIIRNLST